jgi:hypothetical protein
MNKEQIRKLIVARALKTLLSDRLLPLSGCATLRELYEPGNAGLWQIAIRNALIGARDLICLDYGVENEAYSRKGFNKGDFKLAERELVAAAR